MAKRIFLDSMETSNRSKDLNRFNVEVSKKLKIDQSKMLFYQITKSHANTFLFATLGDVSDLQSPEFKKDLEQLDKDTLKKIIDLMPKKLHNSQSKNHVSKKLTQLIDSNVGILNTNLDLFTKYKNFWDQVTPKTIQSKFSNILFILEGISQKWQRSSRQSYDGFVLAFETQTDDIILCFVESDNPIKAKDMQKIYQKYALLKSKICNQSKSQITCSSSTISTQEGQFIPSQGPMGSQEQIDLKPIQQKMKKQKSNFLTWGLMIFVLVLVQQVLWGLKDPNSPFRKKGTLESQQKRELDLIERGLVNGKVHFLNGKEMFEELIQDENIKLIKDKLIEASKQCTSILDEYLIKPTSGLIEQYREKYFANITLKLPQPTPQTLKSYKNFVDQNVLQIFSINPSDPGNSTLNSMKQKFLEIKEWVDSVNNYVQEKIKEFVIWTKENFRAGSTWVRQILGNDTENQQNQVIDAQPEKANVQQNQQI